MKILKIISLERLEQGISRAEVIFPSENRYEVKIRDLFLEPGEIESDKEQRLRWYFEELLSSPYTDREKAKRNYWEALKICLDIKEENKKALVELLEHVKKEN